MSLGGTVEEDRVPSPLEGVRVLEASTGQAGAICAMYLADFGADVVKLETPSGDPTRSEPAFAVWNRNKRSVAVDPLLAGDAARLRDWVLGADVCVLDAAHGAMSTAIDLGGLSGANPGLVVVEVPALPGPAEWSGGGESAELLSAFSGLALRQYSFGGGPVDPVFPYVLSEQGIWAAAATVAALVERAGSGSGQRVTVSGLHGAMVASPGSFILDPALPPDETPAGPGGRNPMYSRYRCADGRWLFLAALTDRFQARAVELLGIGELAADPRLGGDLGQSLLPENREWVREVIAAAIRTRPREEWVATLEGGGCPVGELERRDHWLDHPQLEAIGMRVRVQDPERGTLVMPGVPLVLSETPGSVRAPAPAIGADSDDPPWSARAGASDRAAPRPGPLSGVSVLDLGTILAGPFAGSLLADLGADVVKVEPPSGDPFRRFGYVYNRGMRSLAIDLRDERGRDALLALVARADVVIDNYRQGILEQFGLRDEDLRAVKPDIVTFTIMGFGERGPLAAKLGFDPILQAMSGMMTAQGGDDEPVYHYVAINDVATAPITVLGVCLALLHRARTGVGQRGWTSLAGMSAIMQAGELVDYAHRPAARSGGRDFKGPSALDRYYEVADGWVRVQANEDQFDALAEACGLFTTVGASGDAASDALAAAFAGRSRADVLSELRRLGVAAAPARTRSDLVADQGLRDVGLVQDFSRDGEASYSLPDRFARFSRTERTVDLRPPGLGEHSREILSEAGLDEAAVLALVRAGIVVEGPPVAYAGPGGYK